MCLSGCFDQCGSGAAQYNSGAVAGSGVIGQPGNGSDVILAGSKSQPNPYDGGGEPSYSAGSDGAIGDVHSPWGMTQLPFRTPYFANSFTATQVYQYGCPCRNKGAYTTFTDTFSITRTVSSNGDGTWKYVLTKTGADATGTINPLR